MPPTLSLMTGSALTAVALGAILGAWSRWWLTLYFQTIPGHWGISIANLLGGLLAGLVLAVSESLPTYISPTVKLFLVTGLLGSLTTFSSFTMEVLQYLLQHRWGSAALFATMNIIGSLVATALGYTIVRGLLMSFKG